MAWFMKCPKCGASVNKSKGKPYQEDINKRTVWRQKINYDCSNHKCDWTKTETRDL